MDQPSCECVKRYYGYTNCNCEEPAPFVPCSFPGEHKIRSSVSRTQGACPRHSQKKTRPVPEAGSDYLSGLPENHPLREFRDSISNIIEEGERKRTSRSRESQQSQNQSSGSSPSTASSPKSAANTKLTASSVANTGARSQRTTKKFIENNPQEDELLNILGSSTELNKKPHNKFSRREKGTKTYIHRPNNKNSPHASPPTKKRRQQTFTVGRISTSAESSERCDNREKDTHSHRSE